MDVVRTSQALTAQRPPKPLEAPRPNAPETPKVSADGSLSAAASRAQVEDGIVIESGLFKVQATPPAADEAQGASEQSLEARVSDMVDELNAKLDESKQTRLRFTVDSESGVVVIQVVDKATEEIVRSIPPEEMIALKKRMTEMRGILFDHEG
jgi:flagellar protein FlaG